MTPRPDVWPRTGRPLPWLLAGFLAALFLLPIDGIKLEIPSPVDPYLDRVALVLVLGVWILMAWIGPVRKTRVERPALFLGMTLVFVSIALLSIVINIRDIAIHDLLSLSWNRLALLLAFVFFCWFAVTAMRPGEVHNFSVLLVALATLTAIGVIYERRTGYNVFYELLGGLLKPIASVAPSPTEINPDPLKESRKTIVGPTHHGLAVTAMLVMAMPFAVVNFLRATNPRRWWYALAVALILAAALSTERKTGVLTPVVAMLVIAVYRPRQTLRMAPLLVAMAAFIYVISPGALGTIWELEETFSSDSSVGRSDDYTAISPEFLSHPLLGGGYGTRDIDQVDHVRILDNEYLGQLLTVGLIGTLAFIAMLLSVMVVAHRAIRSGDAERASPALAASASCAAFVVVNLLFDTLSFPQAPYTFFFVAAVATVVASREVPASAPNPAPRPLAPARRLQVGTQ